MIDTLIERASSHLPQIIIGILIAAIITIILVTILTSRSVTKAIKKKVPPKPPAKEAEPEPIPEDKMPPIGGRFSEYLSLKGIFRVGDLSLSFLKSLSFLRSHLGPSDYKYRLPWYLLIGASNAGKTTLLEGADIYTPVGQPDFGIKDARPGCRWWFFNRGIVLDIRGDFFIHERGFRSDEKGWRSILSLLTRYRARRPIDGIILTIPATELYGDSKLTMNELNDRAKFIAKKLETTQNHLGLRLPVYVVITKIDVLKGFQEFCSEIPDRNRGDILGWSNPHPLDISYSPAWIEEALGSITQNLSRIQLEIFAESTTTTPLEGIFSFPNEISYLKDGLSIYLNNIFKTSTYEESLLFRGVFFTGDSGQGSVLSLPESTEDLKRAEDELSAPLSSSPKEIANWQKSLSEFTPSTTRQIFFADDLFDQKIFYETGLSQPIHYRLISANRNLNWAKVGMAAFVGIGTFGLLNAYDNFSKNRDYLLPVLGRINTILQQIPQTSTPNARSNILLFDQNAKHLLEMMQNLQKANFFSIFVPSSWFSRLNERLESSLKVSYEQIILRTIYMDLLLKARDLLTLRPTPQDKTLSIGILLQPIQTTEYQLLKAYVEKFSELLKNINKYNQLKNTHDIALLDDLVEYTFNIKLPEDFRTHYQKFRKILQEVPFPEIDLRPYAPMAQETLRVLYDHFQNDLFSTTDPTSLLGQIHTILDKFGEKPTEELPPVELLRKYSTELSNIANFLGQPGTNWIDGQYFDPGNGFADLMNLISETPLFGPGMVEEFAAKTATSFSTFKNELARLNTLLVERPITATENKPIQTSEGVVGLSKSLSILFAEPFMLQPSGQMFVSNIPQDKVVFWNSKLIDLAVDLTKRYEEFIDKQLPTFPPAIRNTIKMIALRNLQGNIVSYIARAQQISQIDQNLPGSIAAEETLRSKIEDVTEVSPKFVTLLEVLNKGNVGNVFVELREMLGTLSTRLLQQVDTLLEAYGPYRVRDGNFDWWDGVVPVAFEAYAVKDTQDLKSYLEQQRTHIRHLAMDFSQPMVTFLSSVPMRDFQGNRPLLNRWKRIIEQLNSYDKKRPENSVTALEDFLVKDANNINLKNCFDVLPLSDVRAESGDTFLDHRQQFKRDLLARCEVLKRQESIANYTQLVDLFNKNFKNKFPFVGNNVPRDAPDVDPEDIKAFFKQYDQAGGSPLKILDQIYQLGPAAKENLEFLKTLDAVKTFFKGYLTDTSGDVPSFNFKVDFRVNQENETGGNLIIEWNVTTGNGAKISNTDKKKQGRWVFGNDMAFNFRWPDAAEVQPFKDKAQPNLTVDGQTATFQVPGRWSLLWLLRTQLAGSSDFTSASDNIPYTLKFEIPNGPTEKTVVFNRLTLLEPGKGKGPEKALTIPQFPVSAPDLPTEILDVAEKPVLVQKNLLKGEPIQKSVQAQELNTQGQSQQAVQAELAAPAAAAQPVGEKKP
jgi:type VI secretion system protein ImpL